MPGPRTVVQQLMWPFGKKVWRPWSTTRKTDHVVATYIAEGVTLLC